MQSQTEPQKESYSQKEKEELQGSVLNVVTVTKCSFNLFVVDNPGQMLMIGISTSVLQVCRPGEPEGRKKSGDAATN